GVGIFVDDADDLGLGVGLSAEDLGDDLGSEAAVEEFAVGDVGDADADVGGGVVVVARLALGDPVFREDGAVGGAALGRGDERLTEIVVRDRGVAGVALDRDRTANGAVTCIATPNSPTGHTTSLAELRALAARLTGILVIDEAYVDFQEPGAASALELVREFEHVMGVADTVEGIWFGGVAVGVWGGQSEIVVGDCES
ncbi:MAG: aminotransferase class I/II-fold pyridoxal phosphate-dependent enzyme, partial [Coleofasciculaceae cyanobacterium RL_1_1]|nr:aminotransferase class I/II-fold pyridoxal phosphate-dependent enzyme [Coleofasciculaceae cyanobacterium RL_1_1]